MEQIATAMNLQTSDVKEKLNCIAMHANKNENRNQQPQRMQVKQTLHQCTPLQSETAMKTAKVEQLATAMSVQTSSYVKEELKHETKQ